MADIYARLRNWGHWLDYDAAIGPKGARCVSIESRCEPDTGEVWDDDPPEYDAAIVPDVPDAEALQQLIRLLDAVEQYSLAVRYGGMPCVMRFRRISEAAQEKMANNAEILLGEMLRESA